MYHGEHFIMHINVESLSNTPKTNKILCQLDLDKKKKIRGCMFLLWSSQILGRFFIVLSLSVFKVLLYTNTSTWAYLLICIDQAHQAISSKLFLEELQPIPIHFLTITLQLLKNKGFGTLYFFSLLAHFHQDFNKLKSFLFLKINSIFHIHLQNI